MCDIINELPPRIFIWEIGDIYANFLLLRLRLRIYLSNGSEGELKEEVETLDDVHVTGLDGRQVLEHEVPHLQQNKERI